MFVAAVASVVHFAVVGKVPSGADPGNWLALSRKILGEPVMSARVAYPPVVPMILAGLTTVLTPLEALVALGLAARITVGIAAYVVLREAGRMSATLGMGLALFAGYLAEAFAWGGYPQLIGMAVGIVALHATVRYLSAPARENLIAVFGLFAATALTHGLATAQTLVATGFATLALLFLRRVTGGVQTVVRLAAAMTPAVAFWAIWATTPSLSGQPTLNPQQNPRTEVVELLWVVVRESPIVWGGLTILALVAIAIGLRKRQDLLPVEAAAWMFAGISVWVIFLELRSLALFQAGVILGAAYLSGLLPTWRVRYVTVAVAVTLVIASLSVMVYGVGRFEDAVSYYRLVGESELRTLRRLDAISSPGDQVLASRGRNGMPLGWWIEGYAQQPTYTAIEQSFLAFPDERNQASMALDIFDGSVSPTELRRMLRDENIRFVVVDKRGPDADWLGTPAAAQFPVLINTPTIVILDAR